MIQIYEAANQAYEKNGDAVLHPLSCTVSEVLKIPSEMAQHGKVLTLALALMP